jgi:hypothetical protein
LIAVRYRAAALVTTLTATALATLAWSAPASADVAGVQLRMTEPQAFTAGGDPGTVTVVASSTGERPGCRKVRWSLTVRVQGVRLDQVRVRRIEGAAAFPVSVQAGRDSARIVDQRFDPGKLCPGRTVTATYAVAFTGGAGAVAFTSEPRDGAGRLLSTATAQSTVVPGEATASTAPTEPPASPSPSPSASDPDPSPSPSVSDDAGLAPPVDLPATTPPAVAPAAAGHRDNSPSLLVPGLVVGGMLVFLGVGLLMRLRMRSRRAGRGAPGLPPTSFTTYPTR